MDAADFVQLAVVVVVGPYHHYHCFCSYMIGISLLLVEVMLPFAVDKKRIDCVILRFD